MSTRHLAAVAVACLAAAASILILPGRPEAVWREPFSPGLIDPTGPEAVGVRYTRLDTGADDPWRPGDSRVVMADIRYPAADGEHPLRHYGRSQHMAELAMLAWSPDHEERLGLRSGEVNWLFTTHAHRYAPPRHGSFPVVVMGAPPDGMRSSLTALAEDLASHGFVVVTVDHPYDAPYVELWPTRELVESTDAPRRLEEEQRHSARQADLAAVAGQVRELDDEVAPVMALECTIVVSDDLARRAASLTDDPMVEAQIAARYPRVNDALGDSLPSEAAAEDRFRTGSAGFRAALTRQVTRGGDCPSPRSTEVER
ncbi:hypothetical protein [Nocardiopsis suaedae]|uniref:Lipase n=1 Tax=Nocardiopsis suaedae TaxID=3018444 RepID=A0ABT4TI32_9ACTN|nr:hypothetical protein [Nocardiopsis suaedae]MDA2804370.1 hypothetical protein [Nocardiopsis suaedae]